MARPDGEHALIEGFFNGRPFEDDAVYLVAVNKYLLGNDRCGLRGLSADDTIWAQIAGDGEVVQTMIGEYLTEGGEVTPDLFTWRWGFTHSGALDGAEADGPDAAARLTQELKDGQSVVIYSESEQRALTADPSGSALQTVEWPAQGVVLPAPAPEAALRFTVHADGRGIFRFSLPDGRWLATGEGDGLTLTDEPIGPR